MSPGEPGQGNQEHSKTQESGGQKQLGRLQEEQGWVSKVSEAENELLAPRKRGNDVDGE